MLTFKEITTEDTEVLYAFYKNCSYQLCEYSVGVKLMWREYLHPLYALAHGCLIVLNTIGGKIQFDYPVAGENGDIQGALSDIEAYCQEKCIRPVISVVPETVAHTLTFRWPRVNVSNERGWKDYIYLAKDLCNFEGRHYSGQRNHINKFHKLYPEATFKILRSTDLSEIEDFFVRYDKEFSKDTDMAKNELAYAKDMLSMADTGLFRLGGLEYQGKLISFGLAEKCGETLLMHIEKALYSYEGVYPTMVQAFCRQFASDCQYINREDDAKDKGLRTSKMQYRPWILGGKMCFEVGNELDMLEEIPTIATERLTLQPLAQKDMAAYAKLCLDDQRNVYWGYDYRDDLHEELTEAYFLEVANQDWKARYAVNFAIYLKGQFIGEVVLYNCDWHGGMELGCRIDKAFSGHQYGTEAFAAASEWALYELGLERVVAKCYKANAASHRMLSSCMNKSGEDETFYYFERKV